MQCSAALTTKPGELTRSVWPSGLAFATSAVPIVPPAPVRFSITTDCPQLSLIFCAMMRARVSVPPPGDNGNTAIGHGWHSFDNRGLKQNRAIWPRLSQVHFRLNRQADILQFHIIVDPVVAAFPAQP